MFLGTAALTWRRYSTNIGNLCMDSSDFNANLRFYDNFSMHFFNVEGN